MSLTDTVLNAIHALVPGLTPQVAAMPTPSDFLFDQGQVTAFGLSGVPGQRHFQTGLHIGQGPTGAIPVRAMFPGQLRIVGSGVALEPPRADGTSFVTERSGLLIEVSPRAAFQRAVFENPDSPLEYPMPRWVVYEGVEPDSTLTDLSPIRRFETLDFFDFDSSALPPGADALLNSIATDLLAEPSITIRLVGHTDTAGTPEYNLDLGEQRAEAVRDYLISQGVPPDQIGVDTAGESRPRDPHPADVNAAGINRRVEINVLVSFVHTVEPGEAIGTATHGVTVTVLDSLSIYLDPLDVVIRLQPELSQHPLAAHADPLAPSVASNRVHCVSTDAANDGATQPFLYNHVFSFHSSLTDALSSASDNDVIWLHTPSNTVNLMVNRPLSLIGKPGTDGALPELSPVDDANPTLSAVAPSGLADYGLRILGCSFQDGRASAGGAAIRLTHLKNVQIEHCRFQNNFAGPNLTSLEGNGGAIRMEGCRKVLVNSCYFHLNAGMRGGAIYAENCRELVVRGAPSPHLDALLALESEIPTFTLPDPVPNTVSGIPPALTGHGFSAFYIANIARKAGGALCFVNSSFRVRYVYFAENSCIYPKIVEAIPGTVIADGLANTVLGDAGYGGAVAMQNHSSELGTVENEIVASVMLQNTADVGGGIATAGKHDGKSALAGQPQSLVGGGRCVLVRNALHANGASSIGGGVSLLRGTFHLEGNRVSKNTAHQSGGGVSCIARCTVTFADNLILRNRVTRQDPDASPGGGGGIYATFFTGQDYTSLSLTGNKVIGNHSTEDGGGLRATCGSRVELGPGNLFRDNVAYHNGGGISTRNAHLSIAAGNLFENNRTIDGGVGFHRGGDGGAIHSSGGLASLGGGAVLYAPCISDGARLRISGTATDPVRFVGNQAVHQGGALFVNQDVSQAAMTFIGLLKEMLIEHADFDENASFQLLLPNIQGMIGSAIAIRGLTQWHALINHSFADAFVLRHTTIKLSQGTGLYLIHSQGIERDNNVTFIHPDGASNAQDEVIFNP